MPAFCDIVIIATATPRCTWARRGMAPEVGDRREGSAGRDGGRASTGRLGLRLRSCRNGRGRARLGAALPVLLPVYWEWLPRSPNLPRPRSTPRFRELDPEDEEQPFRPMRDLLDAAHRRRFLLPRSTRAGRIRLSSATRGLTGDLSVIVANQAESCRPCCSSTLPTGRRLHRDLQRVRPPLPFSADVRWIHESAPRSSARASAAHGSKITRRVAEHVA